MRIRLVSHVPDAGPLTGAVGPRPVSVDVLDLQAYLNRLASAEPTPGGGSAAALVGAFGAALIAMVARITLGSARHAAVHAEALDLVAAADALRAQFTAARPDDEAAYSAVVAAQSLPRGTEAERTARARQLQVALAGAAEAPLRVAALAAELLAATERAANLKNAGLMSDVACARAFGRAALDAAVANVRVNHRFMRDSERVTDQVDRLEAIRNSARGCEDRAIAAIADVE